MRPSQGTQQKRLSAQPLDQGPSAGQSRLAKYLLARQGLEEGVSSSQSGPEGSFWPIRDLGFYVVNQGCWDFLSSQGLSIVNQGISE